MNTNKKENWLKRNSYIATWIGFILFLGTLIGGTIYIYPNVVPSNCVAEYYEGFGNFIEEECKNISSGEEKYFPPVIIENYVKAQDNSNVEGVLKKTIDTCTMSWRCIYQQKTFDNIKFGESIEVTVKRNSTNETIQVSP